jgi:hypothetical protein
MGMRTRWIGAAVLTLLWCGTAWSADAQPCTPQSVGEAKGQWTHSLSNILPPRHPELPALVKNMEVEAELLHKALGDPTGLAARWYLNVSETIFSKKGLQSAAVNVPLFRYYCGDGKVEVNDEYSDELMIDANDTWSMSGIARFTIGGKRFRLLGSPIGEIRGHPAFEPTWGGIPSGVSYKWVVLVTKPGKSPFRYLTRQELLDHLKKVNENKRPENLALAEQLNPIRLPAVQAAEKEKQLAVFLKGAKDDQQRQNWIERFNKDYLTDDQKREAAKRATIASRDKLAAHLEAVTARYSAEQLKEPAFVNTWLINYDTDYNDGDFDFSPPANTRDCKRAPGCGDMGKPLAILTRTYFDSSLANSVPQFFTVTFQWSAPGNGRDEKFEKLRDDFFARFDFDRLVAMLGK